MLVFQINNHVEICLNLEIGFWILTKPFWQTYQKFTHLKCLFTHHDSFRLDSKRFEFFTTSASCKLSRHILQLDNFDCYMTNFKFQNAISIWMCEILIWFWNFFLNWCSFSWVLWNWTFYFEMVIQFVRNRSLWDGDSNFQINFTLRWWSRNRSLGLLDTYTWQRSVRWDKIKFSNL